MSEAPSVDEGIAVAHHLVVQKEGQVQTLNRKGQQMSKVMCARDVYPSHVGGQESHWVFLIGGVALAVWQLHYLCSTGPVPTATSIAADFGWPGKKGAAPSSTPPVHVWDCRVGKGGARAFQQ